MFCLMTNMRTNERPRCRNAGYLLIHIGYMFNCSQYVVRCVSLKVAFHSSSLVD